MTLRQAVQRGVIYKDSVIYDTETMRLITLERAIKSGMIDGNTGRCAICNNEEVVWYPRESLKYFENMKSLHLH